MEDEYGVPVVEKQVVHHHNNEDRPSVDLRAMESQLLKLLAFTKQLQKEKESCSGS